MEPKASTMAWQSAVTLAQSLAQPSPSSVADVEAFNGSSAYHLSFSTVELVQLKLMLCCPSLVQEKARTFF